ERRPRDGRTDKCIPGLAARISSCLLVGHRATALDAPVQLSVFDGVSRSIPQKHTHLRTHMKGWNHDAITGDDANGRSRCRRWRYHEVGQDLRTGGKSWKPYGSRRGAGKG